MRRHLTALIAFTLCAPPLFAGARYISNQASSAVETVNWTAGVTYAYDGSGNVRSVDKDTFVYDRVGRLVRATVNGRVRVYAYDAWGNRIDCTHEPDKPEQSDCQNGIEIDPETNRVKNVRYDDRGNLEQFEGHLYTYDAVSMARRDQFGTLAREYVYTANDERIGTYQVGSSWNWTVRDASGKVLREFTSADDGTSSTVWKRDYIWRSGVLLASRYPVGGTPVTYHYHADHLGTPRRITDDSDVTIGFHDYYAFGPEVSGGKTELFASPLQYTGHERDSWGSGGFGTLDYMHARYYSPGLGKFLSIDHVQGQPSSPQTWNRYTYVGNNPLRGIDPAGLWTVDCTNRNETECNAIKSIVRQRLRDALASRNAEIRNAAQAYGAEGDEGVIINVGPTKNGTPAETAAPWAVGFDMKLNERPIGYGAAFMLRSIVVTFNSNADINGHNIVHEGGHVMTAQRFFNAMTPQGPNFDMQSNSYDTESAAYRLNALAVADFGAVAFGRQQQHRFTRGMNAQQIQAVIDAILRDPQMGYNVTPQNKGNAWP